jgi:hypothetical protein
MAKSHSSPANIPTNLKPSPAHFLALIYQKPTNTRAHSLISSHTHTHIHTLLHARSLAVADAVSTILDTMPKGGGGGGGLSREDMVDGICIDLLSKVPQCFEREETREKLRRLPGGPTQPLTVHLRQEIDRLNTIIALTTTTLKVRWGGVLCCVVLCCVMSRACGRRVH